MIPNLELGYDSRLAYNYCHHYFYYVERALAVVPQINISYYYWIIIMIIIIITIIRSTSTVTPVADIYQIPNMWKVFVKLWGIISFKNQKDPWRYASYKKNRSDFLSLVSEWQPLDLDGACIKDSHFDHGEKCPHGSEGICIMSWNCVGSSYNVKWRSGFDSLDMYATQWILHKFSQHLWIVTAGKWSH